MDTDKHRWDRELEKVRARYHAVQRGATTTFVEFLKLYTLARLMGWTQSDGD